MMSDIQIRIFVNPLPEVPIALSMEKRSFLSHLCHYHPAGVLDNPRLSQILDLSPQWIEENVGVQQRRFLDDYEGEFPVFELARRALEKLFQQSPELLSECDLLISCSSTDDLQYPGTANLISQHFDLSIPAFHMKNGCASMLFGIEVASALVKSGQYKNVLIVNSEPFASTQVDYAHRSAVLFGDCATAMVVSHQTGDFLIQSLSLGGKGSMDIHSSSQNAKAQKRLQFVLHQKNPSPCQGVFFQKGKRVYEFVTEAMPQAITYFLQQQKLRVDEIDYFIGHQANLKMLREVTDRLNIPESKHLYNIDQFGNTSSAGWVSVLSQELQRGRFKTRDRILVSVFGAGLAWGTLELRKAEALKMHKAA